MTLEVVGAIAISSMIWNIYNLIKIYLLEDKICYQEGQIEAMIRRKEQEPVLSHEDADGVPHCGSCGWVQSWGCNFCDNCGKPLRWE